MSKLDERVQQYNTEAHNRLWERCLAAEAENERLREALGQIMLDTGQEPEAQLAVIREIARAADGDRHE